MLVKKQKCFAWHTIVKIPVIEFKPVLAATAKKTSDFYKDEVGTVYAALNGGFFGSNQSYSLVKYNGTVSSANIKVLK